MLITRKQRFSGLDLFPTEWIKQNIKWTFRRVKALGVWFSTCREEASTLNYKEKTEKISKILNCWQLRRLTLLGKITVIKSLAASQLVYIMSPLPSSKSYLKDINQLLYNFLWDTKGDKIKRSEMLNDYENGGLKMLDIQTFNCALKAKWVQKYLDDNNRGKWKLFFNYFLAKHNGKLLMTGNIKPTDVASLNIQDPFTNKIVEIWSQINYDESPRYFTKISSKTLKEKYEAIKKLESGCANKNVAADCDVSPSTLSTWLKSKDKIMKAFEGGTSSKTQKLKPCGNENLEWALYT